MLLISKIMIENIISIDLIKIFSQINFRFSLPCKKCEKYNLTKIC